MWQGQPELRFVLPKSLPSFLTGPLSPHTTQKLVNKTSLQGKLEPCGQSQAHQLSSESGSIKTRKSEDERQSPFAKYHSIISHTEAAPHLFSNNFLMSICKTTTVSPFPPTRKGKTSPVVRWLRLHAPSAGGAQGLIPGQGTRFHVLQLRPNAAK